MKFLRAEIGVAVLVGVAMFIGVIMLAVFPFPGRSVFLVFALPWISAGIASRINFPFAFCVFAGMALYISDRRSFLIRRSGNKDTAVWLTILGFLMIVESVIDGILILVWMGFWTGGVFGPLSWEGRGILAFLLACDGLGFLFGMLLLFDMRKMLGGKSLYPPSQRRLDMETQTKYPSDLFAKYAERYPHNPEGVLEWHVRKRMKEGRTRELAIRELRNIGDRSI